MTADDPLVILPYARQSRARVGETAETSLSLEQQLAAIREWAARQGATVLSAVLDHDESGRTLARPGLDELRARAAARPGIVIAVYKYDRFARNIIGQELAVQELEAAGVGVVSITEPAGKLSRQMHGVFAEYMSDQLSERLIAIRAASARRGQFVGGTPPYGYRRRELETVIGTDGQPRERRTGPLEPHPEHAPIVREIFARVLAGEPPYAIATDLHQRGVPTATGGGWCLQLVARLLRNPHYLGQVTCRGVVSPGAHPALIEPATWAAVQDRLAKQVPIKRAPAHGFASWCAGLVRHACGSRMYLTPIQGKRRRDGTRGISPCFVCQRSVGINRCGVPHLVVSQRRLEAAVRRCLATDLAGVVTLERAVARARALAGGAEVERTRRALVDRRRLAERRRERARELWLSGDDALADWQAEQARYRAELAAVETALAALPAAPDPARYADAAARLRGIAAVLDQAEGEALRPILEAVGTVIVAPAGITVRYDPPFDAFIPAPTLVGW